MLKNLLQRPIIASKLHFQSKNKFSDLNPEKLQNYLTNKSLLFKDQGPQAFKDLLTQAAKQKQSKIGVYQVYFWTKLFFITSRYQVLAYCIGGTIYTYYTGYYKYLEFQKKNTKRARRSIQKILNTIPFMIISAIFGLWATRFMGLRLIKQISYLPKSNELELQFFSLFCRSKVYNIPIKELVPLKEKLRFDSTAKYMVQSENKKLKNYKYISTYGTGKHSNKQLLPYIVENQDSLAQWYQEWESSYQEEVEIEQKEAEQQEQEQEQDDQQKK